MVEVGPSGVNEQTFGLPIGSETLSLWLRNRNKDHWMKSAQRFLPATVLATGAVLAAAAILTSPVLAQSTPDGRFPVTDEQRHMADQVAQAGVPLSALSPTAPSSYTIKSGDTLWAISQIFLTSPWRWPELWGMNKEQVRNPHLIYPGQTLNLVRAGDRARLELAGSGASAGAAAGAEAMPGVPGDAVRLSPRVRDLASARVAVTSIPANAIEPFLSQPLVVAANELARYPRIVGTTEGRVNLGRGDKAYARGVGEERTENYQVFRTAQPLYDPDDTVRKSPIAYEAFYLGTARLIKRGEVATFMIQEAKQEIGVGDRLVPIERTPMIAYVPRRPDRAVDGRIVSVYGGVKQAGTQQVVAINRGRRDGLEIGHVLALLQTGETVLDRTAPKREFIKLPDERIGEMFVFRVFETLSYALVMRVVKPVQIGDRFERPDDLELASDAAPVQANAAPAATPTVSPGAAATVRN